MLFKKFRQKRIKSKLFYYTNKAAAILDLLESDNFLFENDRQKLKDNLIEYSGKVGKYEALYNGDVKDLESEIKKILDAK